MHHALEILQGIAVIIACLLLLSCCGSAELISGGLPSGGASNPLLTV
jgi:hypothetical protein